jgi:hypothetical protein
MLRACGWMMLIAVTAAGQELPWTQTLERSNEASAKAQPDLAVSLVECAWQQVREAGPSHPAYRWGVNSVTQTFLLLGRPMRAETLYDQAIAAAQDRPALNRDLQIMQAEFLRGRGKEVAAEAVWEKLLPTKRAAESISLASLKDDLGKLSEAEGLYLLAIRQPATKQSQWLVPNWNHSMDLFDAPKAFAEFLGSIGRFEEAERVLPPEPAPVQQDSEQKQPSRLVHHDALTLSEVDLAVLTDNLEAAPNKIWPAIDGGDFDGARAHVLAALDSTSELELQTTNFIEMSERFRRVGRTADVRLILDRYLGAYERLHGSESAEHIEAMKQSIEQFALTGLVDDARRLLYGVESNALLHAGSQSPEFEDVLERQAQALGTEWKTERALKKYYEWLDLRIVLHGATSSSVVAAHRTIAEFHALAGKHDDARTEWLAATEISRSLFAGYGATHAELLNAAAEYFRSRGDKELAERFEAEARRATQTSPNPQHLARAIISGGAHHAAAGVRAAAA